MPIEKSKGPRGSPWRTPWEDRMLTAACGAVRMIWSVGVLYQRRMNVSHTKN